MKGKTKRYSAKITHASTFSVPFVGAEIDESSDKINGKIQRAEQMKIHTMFVIGKRDMEADAVSVRVHGKGNLGAKSRAEAIAEILLSIKERRA